MLQVRPTRRNGGADARVPSTDESAETVRKAQRTLAEIDARTIADEAREAEESRAAELTRWYESDEAVIEQEQTADDALTYEDAP